MLLFGTDIAPELDFAAMQPTAETITGIREEILSKRI